MTHRSCGYTLIELLVVVMIISILTAVGVPQYQNFVEKAKGRESGTTVTMLLGGARMYYADNNAWPTGQLPGNPLIAGKYVPNQDWDHLPYSYYTVIPGDVCHIACGCSAVACSMRTTGPNASLWKYCGWQDGRVDACDGSDAPPL